MSRVEVTQESAPLSDGMLQTVLPLSATSQFVKDNAGNTSALSLSTSLVGIGTATPTARLQVNNATNGALISRFKDTLAATTYIDFKTDPTLTDRMGIYWGSDYRFLSKQGASLFINCEYNAVFANGLQAVTTITPSEVQVGTITGARLAVKGAGATSATTSFLVQNSASTAALTIKDDLSGTFGGVVRINSASGNGLQLRNDGTISYIDSLTSASAAHDLRISAQNINFYSGVSYGTVYAKLFSSGNFGFGNNPTDLGAKVSIDSTTSGFLPPRMTTVQKNLIGTPAAGLIVYDTTLNKLCVRTVATWETITSV